MRRLRSSTFTMRTRSLSRRKHIIKKELEPVSGQTGHDDGEAQENEGMSGPEGEAVETDPVSGSA